MRKSNFIFWVYLPVLCIIFSCPGCVKDKCKNTYSYTYYTPVYKTTAEVRANIKSNAPREIENPGKIYTLGNYIFLNEIDRGVHIIDNSNPSSPQNIEFIEIPGNGDIAIKGNILYADMFTDLVAIDITNPQQVGLKKVIENLFPDRIYGGGFSNSENMIVTDWVGRDTTVELDCSDEGGYTLNNPGVYMNYSSTAAGSQSGGKSSSPIGKGGSMSRFTISHDKLYTVSSWEMDVFDITVAGDPVYTTKVQLDWGAETIFPFKDKLFIGTQTGMYIYGINGGSPVQEGKFGHVRTCDPVIADDNYAYVTLRSGTTCAGFTNELDILALNNLTDPVLQKTYQLTNPHGLSKDGDILFICDGEKGLKIYDASDVMDLKLLTTIEEMETYDVIASNNLALVVAKDGLYQFDYSKPDVVKQLSKINVRQQ